MAFFAASQFLFSDQPASPAHDIDFPGCDANYAAASSAWETALYGEPPASALQVAKAFEDARRAWHGASEDARDHGRNAMYYMRMAADTAEIMAKNGEMVQAADALRESASVAHAYGLSLSHTRWGNNLKETASTHARIMATTGSDPLQGIPTGYEIERNGSGFIVIQHGWDGQQAFSLLISESLQEGEEEGTLILLSKSCDAIGGFNTEQDGKIDEYPVTLGPRTSPEANLFQRLTSVLIFSELSESSPSHFTRTRPEEFFRNAFQETAALTEKTAVERSSSGNGLQNPAAWFSSTGLWMGLGVTLLLATWLVKTRKARQP